MSNKSCSTLNATMLCDKLKENVACIIGLIE